MDSLIYEITLNQYKPKKYRATVNFMTQVIFMRCRKETNIESVAERNPELMEKVTMGDPSSAEALYLIYATVCSAYEVENNGIQMPPENAERLVTDILHSSTRIIKEVSEKAVIALLPRVERRKMKKAQAEQGAALEKVADTVQKHLEKKT